MRGQVGRRCPAGALTLPESPTVAQRLRGQTSCALSVPGAAWMFLWRHLVSEAQTKPWRRLQRQAEITGNLSREPHTQGPRPDLGMRLSSCGPVASFPGRVPPKTPVPAAIKPQ